MGGAYTAVPAASTSVVVPPGWNPIWPFPGAFPPGYEPSLSLSLDAPPAVIPGTPVQNVTTELFDQVTYATSQPSEPIRYTATLQSTGAAVTLKFNGDATFLPSVTKTYTNLSGDFWGDTPEFEFNVDASDIGDTILCTATSSPLGQDEISVTTEILVVATYPWTVEYSLSSTYDAPWPTPSSPYALTSRSMGALTALHVLGETYYSGESYSYSRVGGNQFYWPIWVVTARSQVSQTDPTGEFPSAATFYVMDLDTDGNDLYGSPIVDSEYILGTEEADGSFKTIQALDGDYVYECEVDQDTSDKVTATYTYTFKTYENGQLSETKTKVRVIPDLGTGVKEIWLTVNGSTGAITVINP